MAKHKGQAHAPQSSEEKRTFRLVEVLESLCHAQEPVSYYDCHLITRRLQREQRNPAPAVLQQIAQLHDYPLTTDGGRRILASYLQGLLLRFAQQRTLGSKPLSLRADGKTVRIALGSTLTLHLDERRTVGYRWVHNPQRQRTARLSIRRRQDDIAHPGLAVFTANASRTGTERILFNETPPQHTVPKNIQPRHFEVTVVVEAENAATSF